MLVIGTCREGMGRFRIDSSFAENGDGVFVDLAANLDRFVM